MRYCASCGHELGAGRYCTGCGRPVDDTATAVRPAVPTGTAPPPAPPPPPPPPPAVVPPAQPTSRYPLFADELPPGPAEPPGAPRPPAGGPRPAARPGRTSRRGPRWVVPVVLGAVLALVAGLGLVLLAADRATDTAGGNAPAPASGGAAAPSADRSPATAAPSGPGDLTRSAEVTVPDTAPPSRDLEGRRTEYDARQMLDGDASTAWRMRGDASGEELVVVLSGPATLTRVGLVNGYAKTDPATGLDWYSGNRRLNVVEWAFDDGTTVRQELDHTREMQVITLDQVVTEEVRVRLVSVSAPGKGRTRRDYTAISDLSIVGTPR